MSQRVRVSVCSYTRERERPPQHSVVALCLHTVSPLRVPMSLFIGTGDVGSGPAWGSSLQLDRLQRPSFPHEVTVSDLGVRNATSFEGTQFNPRHPRTLAFAPW